MDHVPRAVFLPGAAGAAEFWSPVAERLPNGWPKTLLSWPGAGDQPHDPDVRGFDDLVALTAAGLEAQSDLIAQSMGGVVAIGLAVRHPEKVRRLALVATSGGVDVAGLGAVDWRAEYRAEYPRAASWVWEEQPDYAETIRAVRAPTLLIWGDADPLSPVSVGRALHGMLAGAALHVVAQGTHNLAREYPDEVARLITEHLRRP